MSENRSPSSAPGLLVLHPDLRRLGGIEGYYRKVLPHLPQPVASLELGRRVDEPGGALRSLRRVVADYRRLSDRLSRPGSDVVLLNPSLKGDMLLREGMLQRMAKARGRRTIVFWRGWEPGVERRIDRHGRRLFRWLYGGTDTFLVLASSFERALRRWGLEQPIHREVTVLDDAAAPGAERVAELVRIRAGLRPRVVLFLARLLRGKGLHETVEAVANLADPQVELWVAGEGPERAEAERRAARAGTRIVFLGHVDGAAKTAVLERASLLCLPSSHGEGLPNSVVEAFSFGIPVVTTATGGLADFFEDGVHGRLVPPGDGAAVAAAIRDLYGDAERHRAISLGNAALAKERFLASSAAQRLAALYRSLQATPA